MDKIIIQKFKNLESKILKFVHEKSKIIGKRGWQKFKLSLSDLSLVKTWPLTVMTLVWPFYLRPRGQAPSERPFFRIPCANSRRCRSKNKDGFDPKDNGKPVDRRNCRRRNFWPFWNKNRNKNKKKWNNWQVLFCFLPLWKKMMQRVLPEKY